jgi:hypothetical protein
MAEANWKEEYLRREKEVREIRVGEEPPATEQPSVDCPYLMAVMPYSTWMAVAKANLALAADNARLEKCADAAAEDLGLLSLRLFDMRRKRNFWRWVAAALGFALVVVVVLRIWR